MMKIKLSDKNFIEEMKNIIKEDLHWEWRTSTGKTFQDIQLWDNNFKGFWAGNDYKLIHKYYEQRPTRRGIFMLIANNAKSYSRGMIKNVYVLVWNK